MSTSTSRGKYYQDRLQLLTREHVALRKRLRWLAAARLLTFLALFPALFVLTPKFMLAGLLLVLGLLIAFLSLVKWSNRLGRLQKKKAQLININEKELQALHYKYNHFDRGDDFQDTEHAFSYDMDLFGEGSVFQFVSRTVTSRGRRLLASLFCTETLDVRVIHLRQEAVKELSGLPGLIQDFRAEGSLEPDVEKDIRDLSAWMKKPAFYLERKGWLLLIRILPLIALFLVTGSFFLSAFQGLAVLVLILQFLIVGLRFKHSSEVHGQISKRLAVLRKYQGLLEAVEHENYSGTLLLEVRKKLLQGKYAASESIKELTRIVSAFDNRLNIIVAVVLEGILLWDLQCVLRMEKWRHERSEYFDDWVEALAQFDALLSLSTLAFNHPDLCYPKLTEECVIAGEDMGHLLLPPGERVNNDFSIKQKGDFVLITGANMAGKSTFLRSVASNMILAMAGAPVCAKTFSFTPMRLFSSMRTSDSLNKHESYFYAELKRLKELLDRLRQGEQLFVILDEILKGTNSTDKQKGSWAALEQIVELRGTGIIATHDLELAKMEQRYPERVRNHCFEIDIDAAEMHFDYKLREGVTTRMNALLLMQQMGIVKG